MQQLRLDGSLYCVPLHEFQFLIAKAHLMRRLKSLKVIIPRRFAFFIKVDVIQHLKFKKMAWPMELMLLCLLVSCRGIASMTSNLRDFSIPENMKFLTFSH